MNHIAILGLGPSVSEYLELTKRLGGRKALFDETWAINALGDVFACDLVFHMDDVRIQQARADAAPGSNIAAMLKWLKTTSTPGLTSRPHPDYPALSAYPLADVVNTFGQAYFNSTAAYAIAYAVWRKRVYRNVDRISVFGFDFTYPNAHHAEKGRACVEFWLGIAVAEGIDVKVPHVSSLLDACSPSERLYGFDTLDVEFKKEAGGLVSVVMTEKPAEQVPSAEAIERRYDHTAHPNPLVSVAT